MCVLHIWRYILVFSGKGSILSLRKKEARTVFYIFSTFSWQIDASVNHVSGFSSIFAANIRSRLFSANDSKCKPGFRRITTSSRPPPLYSTPVDRVQCRSSHPDYSPSEEYFWVFPMGSSHFNTGKSKLDLCDVQ